jgi:hypothetical protein
MKKLGPDVSTSHCSRVVSSFSLRILPGDISLSPLIPSTTASSAGLNSGRFINDSAFSRSCAGVIRRMKRNRGKALGFSKIVIPLGVTATGRTHSIILFNSTLRDRSPNLELHDARAFVAVNPKEDFRYRTDMGFNTEAAGRTELCGCVPGIARFCHDFLHRDRKIRNTDLG